MKNYNCDKLQQELIDIDWDTNVSNIDIFADSFVSDVENIVDRMSVCLHKQKYLDKVWITSEIREMMRERVFLYKKAVIDKTENIWNE